MTGRRHEVVAHALLLLQGGFGLLAALGMVVVMGGNVAYAPVPLLGCVLLFTLAGLVARRRRWALIVAIVVEGMALAGWLLQVFAGLLPPIDYTVNLVGLLTTVALPVCVVVLCSRALAER